MLCEICLSDPSANIHTLEETTKTFHYFMKQADNKNVSVSGFHVKEINIHQPILTQSSTQTLEWGMSFNLETL